MYIIYVIWKLDFFTAVFGFDMADFFSRAYVIIIIIIIIIVFIFI